METEGVEAAFLAFCQQQPEGGTTRAFCEQHPDFKAVELVEAINALSSKGMVELFKSGSQLVYRAVAAHDVELYAAAWAAVPLTLC